MYTFPEGQALAFKAIFGTSDIQKLQAIEKDPAAYWDEREKALKEAMTHRKFCEIYTQESQNFIQAESAQTGYVPWFCRWPDKIEQHAKERIGEDDPAYPTAVAFFTALACDHMRDPMREGLNKMRLEMDFDTMLDQFKKPRELSHELNERLRWIICDHAEFSIFDSLIMLSNQEYLCGAAPFHQRMHYQSHQKPDGSYQFWGAHGALIHDVVAHARKQLLLERTLCEKGISHHKYFKKCWNKKSLVKNDIFALAEQNLGCFYNFHELATVNGAWNTDNLRSLIFPKTRYLTDMGFFQIIPYFTAYKSPGFDWRKTPVKPLSMDDAQAHKTLLHFRLKYCGAHGEAILSRATRKPRTCTLL